MIDGSVRTGATFDAWWLPGFTPTAETRWWTLDGGTCQVRAPRLTARQLADVMEQLRAARASYLRALTVDQIAKTIGAAVHRWLDPFSPYLDEAEQRIAAFTGFSEAAVRKGLAGFLGTLRTENLRRLLRDELGDPELLDGFRPRLAAPGLSRATGPELVVHSFAGNVPGLPAQSLVAATLCKAASLGKVASAEPIFASLFLRSLADVDPRLAACLAATYWPGEDADLAAAALGGADVVVAYGSEDTVAAVARQVPPGRRLIAYGHKLSFGVVGRERLQPGTLDDLADRAAYDVARFDQQGCLSPHLFYVEEGGESTPRDFARALAGALDRWSAIVPRGRLGEPELARAAAVRRDHQFRSATTGGAVFGGGQSQAWCVLFDTGRDFVASCLNRTAWVKPLRDAADLPQLLAPVRRYAQTAGIAFAGPRLGEVADILADVGLDRVCPIGQMGDPPVTWHHDGRFVLLDFLRFTDVEPETSAGRWEFGHPADGLLRVWR